MKHTRTLGVALLSLFVATACENTAPGDELDPILNEQAAEMAADAALEDLQEMGFAPAALSTEGVPSTRSRTVTWYDADGNEQSAYDPQLTASIRIVSEISNAVQRGDWSASVERSRDMTVSGLEGDETSRTWNGTGSSEVMRSRMADDGDRSFDLSATSVITDVVRNLPRGENPYPASGTITRTITIEITNGPNGDETRTRTVTIEFNGTQFATLTVNGETFEVDLAARENDRASRKRDRNSDR